MFLLSYMFIAVVIVYIGLSIFLYKFTKKRFPQKKYLPKLVVAVFILLPTYDIIITIMLGGYYCLTTQGTYINKRVEYPMSIYWEDNVYPGFSADDRRLMIKNYLDGIHLKTMALNGDDGEIYVYLREVPTEEYNVINSKLLLETKKYNQLDKQFTKKLLKENKPLWLELRDKFNEARKIVDELEKQRNQLVESCPVQEEIFTKQSMPKVNYTVTFNEVKLNFFSRKFLYLDETKIIDNQIGEIIAYNLRVMRRFFNLVPAMPGQRYYESLICGVNYYGFERKIFLYKGIHTSGRHTESLNEKLYKKYINGEK